MNLQRSELKHNIFNLAAPKKGGGRPLKIAIACPGIGLVQRGFERLFCDLFDLMKDEFDITLFKGGGHQNQSEKVLLFASRNGLLTKIFPIHKLFGRTRMHSECMTFALALLPYLKNGRYDIVHCIDPPLTRILYKFRNLLGMRFKLLFTHGCGMRPTDYPPADHMHQISKVTYEEYLSFGIPSLYMTLLPCGIYPDRFITSLSRKELRQAYEIQQDVFVILCVAALNRNHKRVDYLIEEVARLDGNFLLWLDGSLDFGEPDLIDFAKRRLGHKCRISHVSSDKVGELYKLADVMVLPSLDEAFGLVIIESASTGLPVITHNGPHFQWLLSSAESWTNMEKKGDLTERLDFLMNNYEELDKLRCKEEICQRFDWKNLKERYIKLYYDTAKQDTI